MARLNDGVLLQLKLKRERELELIVASKCFKQKDLTYLQAHACKNYMFENDFKLNMIYNFTGDHMAKHLVDLERCHSGPAFEALEGLEEKDRFFLACKQNWRTDMMQNVIPDLEAKAKATLS